MSDSARAAGLVLLVLPAMPAMPGRRVTRGPEGGTLWTARPARLRRRGFENGSSGWAATWRPVGLNKPFYAAPQGKLGECPAASGFVRCGDRLGRLAAAARMRAARRQWRGLAVLSGLGRR